MFCKDVTLRAKHCAQTVTAQVVNQDPEALYPSFLDDKEGHGDDAVCTRGGTAATATASGDVNSEASLLRGARYPALQSGLVCTREQQELEG